jgi:hypothetical protein
MQMSDDRMLESERSVLAAQLTAGMLASGAYTLTKDVPKDAAFVVELFRAVLDELDK